MNLIKKLTTSLFLLSMVYSANAAVILDITFDDFPNETSFGVWEVGADTSDIFAGIAYDVDASSPIGFGDGFVLPGDFVGEAPGPWQFIWDLGPGDYVFGIFDSFADGICCGFGLGEYSLTVDGALAVEGGVFTDVEFTEFSVVDAAPEPVPAPNVLAILAFALLALRVNRRRIRK